MVREACEEKQEPLTKHTGDDDDDDDDMRTFSTAKPTSGQVYAQQNETSPLSRFLPNILYVVYPTRRREKCVVVGPPPPPSFAPRCHYSYSPAGCLLLHPRRSV